MCLPIFLITRVFIKSIIIIIVIMLLLFSFFFFNFRQIILQFDFALLDFGIGSELLFSISSVSIYYGTQSHIRVKSYCRLNLLRASTLNSELLDILRDSIRHPTKKLLSFEFDQSFGIQFRASRYITGLNQTSE